MLPPGFQYLHIKIEMTSKPF